MTTTYGIESSDGHRLRMGFRSASEAREAAQSSADKRGEPFRVLEVPPAGDVRAIETVEPQ